MNSVGEILRTERVNQGRELAEIAEELCLTQSYLRAIERDDLKSLPGNSFYYKNFVKQYASILGVDQKRLQPGVEALVASEEPPPLPGKDPRYPVRQKPVPSEPSALRRLDPIVEDNNRRDYSHRPVGTSVIGLGVVLVACSGFYSWWNRTPSVRISVPPPQYDLPVGTPVSVPDAPPAPVQVAPIANQTAPAAAAATIAVTTTTGTDGVNRVELNLSATESTWLSITSEGKPIFSGILQPSQTKTLTGLEVAMLKVGNAGAVDVRWNGKPIGPIGPRGQVRVVRFTPENFQILGPSQTL